MGSVLWCCSLNELVHSLLVLKLFCVACGPWPGKLAMAVAELLKWGVDLAGIHNVCEAMSGLRFCGCAHEPTLKINGY